MGADDAPDQSNSPLGSLSTHLSEIPQRVEIDALDVGLLRLLVRDARMPQKHIADELGLSAPAVADRIARLIRRGVIRGYSADVNMEALGYSNVLYVSVVAAFDADRGRLMTELAAAPGVEEVTLMTGSADLLVRMRVQDSARFREVLGSSVWRIAGIVRAETSVSIGHARGEHPTLRILDEIADRLES